MSDDQTIIEQMQLAFSRASIPLQDHLWRDLRFADIDGLDSVSVIRLMMSLEQIFQIEISHREAARLQRIGDFIDFVSVYPARKT